MTDRQPPYEDDEPELTPEEAEAQISSFIDATDQASSTPTALLADQAIEHVRTAWREIDAITSAQRNNNVIAMMLLVSQRARELDPADPDHWICLAASTILSSQIPGPGRRP
ncbi:MAG TPA: hypothetical protein VJ927_04950 [Actinomycetota bacterium]|nr:hypothetical protein [Actinomycetota bacterium]